MHDCNRNLVCSWLYWPCPLPGYNYMYLALMSALSFLLQWSGCQWSLLVESSTHSPRVGCQQSGDRRHSVPAGIHSADTGCENKEERSNWAAGTMPGCENPKAWWVFLSCVCKTQCVEKHPRFHWGFNPGLSYTRPVPLSPSFRIKSHGVGNPVSFVCKAAPGGNHYITELLTLHTLNLTHLVCIRLVV